MYDSWLTQSMFENMIPDIDQILTILQQLAWKRPTKNLHLPAWRSVRQSSNPIIKQIQIKRLQNFEGIISTSRLKNGGCALLKQKEQQGTHHFHFKKRRFVSKGTSGAAVWLGCFTEAAGGMDTAGSHCCAMCVFLGLNHLTLSRYCR